MDGVIIKEHFHLPSGQLICTPWLVPVSVVMATEVVRPALTMSLKFRSRLAPTSTVTPTE